MVRLNKNTRMEPWVQILIAILGSSGITTLVNNYLHTRRAPKSDSDRHELEREKAVFEQRMQEQSNILEAGEDIRKEQREEIERLQKRLSSLEDQFTKLNTDFLNTLGIVRELRIHNDELTRRLTNLTHTVAEKADN